MRCRWTHEVTLLRPVAAFDALRRWRACCDIFDDWRLALLIAGANGLPIAQHRNDEGLPIHAIGCRPKQTAAVHTAYASRAR